METTTVQPVIKPRNPKTASRLSDLVFGLGQIYCGHFVRGLLIYFISFMIASVWILLIALMKGRFFEALLIGLVPGIALWLFAKFDARRLAAKAPADYVLKEYNRWYVYAMLVVLVLPLAVCGAMFVRAEAYEAFVIVTNRMAPTFQVGDRVLANKTIYDVEPMKRGDVVVVRSPNSLRIKFVQRLIALPGDKVQSDGANILVNGLVILRPQVASATQPATRPAGLAFEKAIPSGHGYFIYDNPNGDPDNHNTMGDLGEVPLSNVVGRVELIYWPWPGRVK